MKRIGKLFDKICDIDNLELADKKARKNKRNRCDILLHDKNRDLNILKLHEALVNKTFTTSKYKEFKIFEGKARIIASLPYYPDRIVHHALMNILEPIFVSTFISHTYSCIKGKGIHAAANALKLALKNVEGTTYCLKLDVKQFYPSINHDVLKDLLRRKFKDRDLLWLLDDIIGSADGIPIGNFTSQFFANFYLTGFDHWLKETKRVKYYFRYADDMVILSNDKQYLHRLLADIREYLDVELKLTVKHNYQVFIVDVRGIDFLGYVFYHTHVMIRKSIKKNFARMLAIRPRQESIAPYLGWLKHCNGKHLIKKLLHHDNQRILHINQID